MSALHRIFRPIKNAVRWYSKQGIAAQVFFWAAILSANATLPMRDYIFLRDFAENVVVGTIENICNIGRTPAVIVTVANQDSSYEMFTYSGRNINGMMGDRVIAHYDPRVRDGVDNFLRRPLLLYLKKIEGQSPIVMVSRRDLDPKVARARLCATLFLLSVFCLAVVLVKGRWFSKNGDRHGS